MKQWISILLCAMLCTLIFTACSKGENTESSDNIKEAASVEIESSAPEVSEVSVTQNEDGNSKESAIAVELGSTVTGTVASNETAWFKFKTSDSAGIEYAVKAVNTSVGSSSLTVKVFDENDNELGYSKALGDGIPGTFTASDFAPNTVYYVSVSAYMSDEANYNLCIKDKNAPAAAVNTFAAEESGAITAGTNQINAAMVKPGIKVTGTVESGNYAWFGFTTGKMKGDPYAISFVNTTAGTDYLYGYLYDEYGNELGNTSANSDGVPVTINTDELEADTSYYICLTPRLSENLGYAVSVKNLNENYPDSGLDTGSAGTNLTGDEVIPGSNQDDAILVPLGTKVYGTLAGNTYGWFAFTTGEKGTTYNITCVNATEKTDSLIVKLYDELGKDLGYADANSNGVPATISLNNLEANTTYYVRLNPRLDETIDYSVVVKDPNSKTTAFKTVGNFAQARGAESMDPNKAFAGSNLNDALLLPYKTKVTGTVGAEEFAWFAFTTGKEKGATYSASYVNKTPNSEELDMELFDEYGNQIDWTRAYADGVTGTISKDNLEPETTYYLCIYSRLSDTIDYSLNITSSEEEKKEKKALVFETPFEINETQVQFVMNEDTFIDENKAIEVMKPVAEAILANPEHSILIAGSTATDGTQESCIDLSVRRAEAVKNLLIKEYKVPESQLKVAGLGYADDPFERGKDIDENGNFVESEGRKNRRVVVLDAEDPIAVKILKKNK